MTINLEFFSPGSPSVPLLDVCVDAGLVAFDPKMARGAIFLPEALMNVKLSIGLHQTLEKFVFINPQSTILNCTCASSAARRSSRTLRYETKARFAVSCRRWARVTLKQRRTV